METATATVVDLRGVEPTDSGMAESGPTRAGLTERERAILTFERKWWRYAGGKEQALMEMFQLSPTRYFQVLNSLIDQPAALAFDPMLVKRLRRMRHTRQLARSTARRANG